MASSLPKPALIGDDVGCDTLGKQPIVEPYSLSYTLRNKCETRAVAAADKMSTILPRFRCAAAVAAALLCSPALGQNLGTVGVFVVNQPWLHPARKAQTTHAYMNLTSSEGARLLGARSEDGRRVSLRSARGAAAAGLALPAKTEVALAPGHDHLSLAGLTRTLKIGDRVKITLIVRDDKGTVHEVAVDAEVRHRSPVDDERRAHHH